MRVRWDWRVNVSANSCLPAPTIHTLARTLRASCALCPASCPSLPALMISAMSTIAISAKFDRSVDEVSEFIGIPGLCARLSASSCLPAPEVDAPANT